MIRRVRWIAGMTGLVALPFVVFTVYLSYSRMNLATSTLIDSGGILLSVLAGVACIWLLPLAWKPRLIASLGYLPLAAGVLVVYGFFYVCSAFERCL